jgi:hypothetical protein
MEVGQSPNWGCSAKEKKMTKYSWLVRLKLNSSKSIAVGASDQFLFSLRALKLVVFVVAYLTRF